VEESSVQEPVVEEPAVQETPVAPVSATDNEIELLALVTMAEAEGESVEGKRLVIDTVLNRVDSTRWPDTIKGVIYQPGQFTSMSNGRSDRCRVTDEVRQLVREELLSRTNSEVVYFRTKHYTKYGTPLFKVGNHYFSKL
jgi:N-acetylmuramoyl-L-alanine amidase